MRAMALGLMLALGVSATVRADDAAKPMVIDLWPGAAPGETGTIGEEKQTKKNETVTSITNVTKPTMSVYRAAAPLNGGVIILVFPGGGYTNLAWDHEGEQVARWLNSIGVTAAVVKYRVPRREGTPRGEPPIQALMDAQRAMSLVRSKAREWGGDPDRVGVLGFSAGGHLGAWASTNYDKRAYEPIDDADKANLRPDFSILIYAGGVAKKGATELAPEIKVDSKTPPTFLVHATNDSSENSALLYLALKREGVPAELHIYATGGHGFGMRPDTQPYAAWPKRCEEWMRSIKVLKPAERP